MYCDLYIYNQKQYMFVYMNSALHIQKVILLNMVYGVKELRINKKMKNS